MTSLPDVSYWFFLILQSFTICIYCFWNLVCSLLKIFIEEEFDDTKGTIRIHISKKNRQHNGQKKKYKRTNNDLQNTYKTKDRVTRTPLKTGVELRCSWRVSSSCSTSGTRRVNLDTNPVISREWGKDREVFTTSGTYPWYVFDYFSQLADVLFRWVVLKQRRN